MFVVAVRDMGSNVQSNVLRFRTPLKNTFRLYFWIPALALISGCAVGDFMGTYFNTYYNAQHLFVEAETAVLTTPATKQADTTFLPPFNVPGDAKTKFGSVIEKCSKILQYHPSSSLVDDALMMIGKSFYYQNENVKAERKFKELLDGYPESDLGDEARLLLAQTYYRQNDRQKAYDAAKQANEIALKNGREDLAAQSSTLLAEIDLGNKNIERAIESYQRAAELGGTGEQQASAYLKVADLYIRQSQFAKALEAYRSASNASTNYVTEYKAKLGIARMLSSLGEHERSLSRLEDLRSSINNKEFFGEIDLEIGNVYKNKEDYTAAAEQYRYVDTTYGHTEVSARSYYELGLLYETKWFAYDSARSVYNKGRNEFTPAPVTALLQRRADYLNKYFANLSDIAKYDSIRTRILNPVMPAPAIPDTSQADSSAHDRVQKPDSSAAKVQPPTIPLDSVEHRIASDQTEIAGLFYATIGLPDSARAWYLRVLREYPHSPSAPRAKYMLAQLYSQDTLVARSTVDSLYKEIVRQHPESEFADEARRLLGLPARRKLTDVADSLYLRGEQLARSGQQTAAIGVFSSLVNMYPSSRLASKAQYAIGWLYEQMNTNPDSTIAQYRRLVTQYPSSEYADRVRPKLAYLDIQKQGATTPKDSVATPVQKNNEVRDAREQASQPRRDRRKPDDMEELPPAPRNEPARDTNGGKRE